MVHSCSFWLWLWCRDLLDYSGNDTECRSRSVVGSGKEFCRYQPLEHTPFVYRPGGDLRASGSSHTDIAFWDYDCHPDLYVECCF